ncbi:MAG: histidine ammonia-lyase [Bacteroidia bacterium]|nr:MAG: histidine ammonia-lyase [Bacteroidia bacterium]
MHLQKNQRIIIKKLINENLQTLTYEKEFLYASQKSFEYLNEFIKNADKPIYGVNTGFGSLCNVKISSEELNQLQENLIKSHACGVGKLLPPEIVKWILFSKIINLSLGYSAVNPEIIQRLIEMFNHKIYPVIYQQGSLGASGDLAPLAHLSLTLIGKGKVYYENQIVDTKVVFEKMGWRKINLSPKEGLALLNGTQYMSGIGIYILTHLLPLFIATNVIAAISLEAFCCRNEPFDKLIHEARPHVGQKFVAELINKILQESPSFYSNESKAVQDPYSFRCIPQVHGASYDLIQFFQQVIEAEINSVTDNPLVFSEENKILSGGNFHGQILSNAFDIVALAMNQLGGISERRVYQLISGSRNLPSFLVKKPGLNSGFMIPQYTAASLVNRNKILCTPASADSIVSSNGQEDYVSMGANAANKSLEILENLKDILAIELFTAAQAFEFRRPSQSSEFIENILIEYRKIVPFIEEDCEMYLYIRLTKEFIEKNMLKWYNELND